MLKEQMWIVLSYFLIRHTQKTAAGGIMVVNTEYVLGQSLSFHSGSITGCLCVYYYETL